MEKVEKIIDSKIIEIFKVSMEDDLGEDLLELYFNIESQNGLSAFGLSIASDGEAIRFRVLNAPITTNSFAYEIFNVTQILNEDLSVLINDTIQDIKFGLGETLIEKQTVIYYFKLKTNRNELLFFNNGDTGAYSFDRIEEILEQDIYGYYWSQSLPVGQK